MLHWATDRLLTKYTSGATLLYCSDECVCVCGRTLKSVHGEWTTTLWAWPVICTCRYLTMTMTVTRSPTTSSPSLPRRTSRATWRRRTYDVYSSSLCCRSRMKATSWYNSTTTDSCFGFTCNTRSVVHVSVTASSLFSSCFYASATRVAHLCAVMFLTCPSVCVCVQYLVGDILWPAGHRRLVFWVYRPPEGS